ncbi:unnamed protein product [Linum trigynum]|uniref:Uncharacterized protein n=1 Tax=Linum trigynum TaxID=586398 RepID=A0AAV2EJH7_9ROSI
MAHYIVAHRHNQSLRTLRLESLLLLNAGPDDIARHGFHLLTTLELLHCTFYDDGDYSAADFAKVKLLLSFENLPNLKCLKLLYCESRHPVKLSAPQLLELEIGVCSLISIVDTG